MSSEVSRSRFSKEVRAEYVRAFKESGLSKSEFYRKHGLKRSTLQSWIERSARGSNRSQGGIEGSRGKKPSGSFSKVQVRSEGFLQAPFVLYFPSGLRLESSTLPEARWFQEVGGLS